MQVQSRSHGQIICRQKLREAISAKRAKVTTDTDGHKKLSAPNKTPNIKRSGKYCQIKTFFPGGYYSW